MKRFILFFTLICLVAGFGFSQTRTGNIYGKVVDEGKTGLPGILVTLSGDLVGKMTTISNNSGNFRFLSLSPGTYDVKAELEDYATIVRKDIRVALGSNVTLNITLVPKKIKEEIIVTAAPVAVDAKKTTHATNMTKEEMQAIPSARDPWAVMELAPGVSMGKVNVGGSESGQQPGFVSRSSGRSNAVWNMDGIDVTDNAANGASPVYFDFDAFEEIQVQTAANDITSFTAGLQINFVTKRGSNKFSGGGRFYMSSDKFQSENTPAEMAEEDLTADHINSMYDYGANVGGPLIQDKLWFWASGSIQDIKKTTITSFPKREKLVNAEFKANAIFGRHRIESFFTYSESRKDGRLPSSSRPLDVPRYKQRKPKPFIKFQDEFIASDSLFLSAKASYFGAGFKLTPQGGLGPADWDRARGYYVTPQYQQTDYIRPQYFAQVSGNLFVENLLGTNHEFKFGVEYKYSHIEMDRDKYPYRRYWTDYEDGDARYAYLYRPKDNIDNYIHRYGFYLQDSIDLGRLTILAALRFDHQSGGTNAMDVGGSNVSWVPDGWQLPGVSLQAKKINFAFKTFSPRLGFIYDLRGNAKTLLKVNFGIYGTHLNDAYLENLGDTYGYYYWKWEDDNSDGDVQTSELGSTSPYRQRDYYTSLEPEELFDENLSSPLTMEITAGIEHEIVEDLAGGLTFIYRKNYNDIWELNYIDDNGTLRLPRPEDWVIGGNIPDEYGGHPWYEMGGDLEQVTSKWTTQQPDWYSRYTAIEITFRKRLTSSSPWMLNGSFTFANWKQFYPTRASYNDPTNHEPIDMYHGQYSGSTQTGTGASINPRWMAKLGFAVKLPLELNLGGTLTAREGFIAPKHFYISSGDRNEMVNGISVQLDPRGTYRLPNLFMLNLRLDRTFKIQGIKLILSLDLFNVFNSNTTLDEEYAADQSNYEQILQVMFPRIFRLGVRVRF